MSRQRYSPRPTPCVRGEPFADCEEAWFWAVETSDNVGAGARVRAGMSTNQRPCDARDILGVVARLYRAGRLQRAHLNTLFHFARHRMPPDPRVEEERGDLLRWDEALARMDPILRAKGVLTDHFERVGANKT
jgi:hypothetical protein